MIVFFSSSSNAAILNFEGMNTYSSSYSSGGFDFEFNFSGWFIDNNTSYNGNGTTVLSGQGRNGYVDISMTDSSLFDVSAFDASVMHLGYTSGSIFATGFLSGGGTVTQTFSLTDSFDPFVLSGFTDLTSLRFGEDGGSSTWQSSGGISIDNLTYNDGGQIPSAVPVPAAVWLFGTAIAGFAGFSRFKKKTA